MAPIQMFRQCSDSVPTAIACGARRSTRRPVQRPRRRSARSGKATDRDVRRPRSVVHAPVALLAASRPTKSSSDATPSSARAPRSSRSGTFSMSMPTGRPCAIANAIQSPLCDQLTVASVSAIDGDRRRRVGRDRRESRAGDRARSSPRRVRTRNGRGRPAPESRDPPVSSGPSIATKAGSRAASVTTGNIHASTFVVVMTASRERTIRYSHAPDAICS